MSNPIFRKSFSEPDLTRLNRSEVSAPDSRVANSIFKLMEESDLSGRPTPPLSRISRIFIEALPDSINQTFLESKRCQFKPFSSEFFPSLEAIEDKNGPDKTYRENKKYRLDELQQHMEIPPLDTVLAQTARDYKGIKYTIFAKVNLIGEEKEVERNQYQIAEIGMNQEESRRFAEVLSGKIEQCGFETQEERALVLDRCHQAIFNFLIRDEEGRFEGGTADGKIPSEIQIRFQQNSVVVIGHCPAMAIIKLGETPNTSVVREGRVFIHINKNESEITIDLVQTATATPFFAYDPQSRDRIYFPSPSRKELEGFCHPVVALTDMDPSAQVQAVNLLLEQGRLSLKLDGIQITNLNYSHFKKFSEEIQRDLLHATFVNFGFDKVDITKIATDLEMERKLFKPVEIDWSIQDKTNSFQRQAFAIQLTAFSPINPTKIIITGKK